MDHLLSMELLLIENNRMKPSGLVHFSVKRFQLNSYNDDFYLVLRDHSLRFCSLKTR